MPFLPLILAFAGAAAGSLVGGALATSIGWLAGSVIGAALQGKPHESGPALESAYTSSTQYGSPIKRVKGTKRIAGDVIWSEGLLESQRRSTHAPNIFYRWAILLCEGEIDSVARMWANGKLLFDLSNPSDEDFIATPQSGGMLITLKQKGRRGTIRIYFGTETQTADPAMEEVEGSGEVPGHRGVAYAVFYGSSPTSRWGLHLRDFGNQVPQTEAEIIKDASAAAGAADGAWEEVSLEGGESKFQARKDFGGFVSEGHIVVMGGEAAGSTYLNSIWYMAPGKGAGSKGWTPADVTLPTASSKIIIAKIFWDVSGLYSDTVYVLGGYNGSNLSSYDIWINNPPQTGDTSSMWNSEGTHIAVDPDDGKPFPSSDGKAVIVASSDGWEIILTLGAALWRGNTADAEGVPSASEHNDVYWSLANDTNGLGARTGHFMMAYSPGGEGGDTQIAVVGGGDNKAFILSGDSFSEKENDLTNGDGSGDDVIGLAVEPQSDGTNRLVALTNIGDNIELYRANADLTAWTKISLHATGKPVDYDGCPGFVCFNGTFWILGGSQPGVNGGAVHNIVHKVKIGRTESAEEAGSGERNLDDWVSEICEEAGLTAGEITVTELASTRVYGFLRANLSSAIEDLRILREAYFFDIIESMGRIVFALRGGASEKTLDSTDIGYLPENQQALDYLETTQLNPLRISQRISVKFYDRENNHLIGEQHDSRSVVTSGDVQVFNMPLSLNNTEAVEIANVLLYDQWLTKREAKLTVSLEHLDLDPGDVITLSLTNVDYQVRITSMAYDPENRVSLGCVIENADLYSISRTGAGTQADTDAGGYGYYNAPPYFAFLDIPIVDREHDDYGFYAALGTISATDAVIDRYDVWRSMDQGVTWDKAFDGENLVTTTIGEVPTALGGGVTALVVDEKNTLDVTVAYTSSTLETITDDALYAGANLALVGKEIIAFKTESLSGDVYTISNLLRGLFGTENEIDSHETGERFILLTDETGLSLIGRILQNRYDPSDFMYKIVSYGDDHDLVEEVRGFRNESIGKRPYPVGNASVLTDPGQSGVCKIFYTWQLEWTRRPRFAPPWWSVRPVPLKTEEERYEIAFLDGSGDEITEPIELENVGHSPWKQPEHAVSFEELKRYHGAVLVYHMTNPNFSADIELYQVSDVGRGSKTTLTLSWS